MECVCVVEVGDCNVYLCVNEVFYEIIYCVIGNFYMVEMVIEFWCCIGFFCVKKFCDIEDLIEFVKSY